MAIVTVEGAELVVTITGADRLLALKKEVRVPLAHVRGATFDPGVAKDPKGWRGPGTHLPGVVVAGTFHQDGEKTFWDVRRADHAVVIQLADETYERLVVDVEDPDATVALVEGARR